MPDRKGIPNKNKRFLLRRLQDMYGDDFHPIMRMAQNAVEMQGIADGIQHDANAPVEEKVAKFSALKEAQIAWGRVAEYVEPKLKAVEIQPSVGDEGDPTPVTVTFRGVAALPNA